LKILVTISLVSALYLSGGGLPEMHVHAEDVDAYARRRDSAAQRLEVEAHLAVCPTCKSKVAAAVEFSLALAHLHREAAEMRDSHRVPTDDPATLQILTPPSPDHWDVRIRDISKGGMCVRTPKAIERGAHVKVQRGTTTARGEVRYCVAVGDMFHVGIRLMEVP
jgi:anti-sigma factor RsiW